MLAFSGRKTYARAVWAACECNSAPPHVRQALAAHAEPRCPDGHGDPRTNAPPPAAMASPSMLM
eukprot:12894686-Alexandrium_andersonii.AAC.1